MVIQSKISNDIINLGTGIYTVTEIAKILRIPYFKVNRWLNKYWDGILSKEFKTQFSYKVDNSKIVSFHTLIEFYVTYQLYNSGVKINEIIRARQELGKITRAQFPFAQKQVLNNIRTDGSKVFFEIGKRDFVSLDGTHQLNLLLIQDFFKNLDFDNNSLAIKFWPLGKSKSIIVDPERQFGHPVIGQSNIYPEIINSMIKAGDSKEFVGLLYNLEPNEINDAIEYCNAA
ncbi:MAG TPA: DUF433 domain-containing protein [Saprospiraceae bacterium]|nr:DUF433 domain-containing protein [Saprospiraceae bacterium]